METKKQLKAKKRRKSFLRLNNILKSQKAQIKNGNRIKISVKFPKSKKLT